MTRPQDAEERDRLDEVRREAEKRYALNRKMKRAEHGFPRPDECSDCRDLGQGCGR